MSKPKLTTTPKGKKPSILFAFTRMIVEMFKCIPFTTTMFCILDVLHASSYILVVMASQLLFDSVARVASGAPLSQVSMPLLFFGFSSIYLEVVNALSNFHIEYPSPNVLSKLYQRVFMKASRVSPIEFERPAFLNMISKAKQGVDMGYFSASLGLMLGTFYLPYFVFMGIYLRTLSPTLIIAMFLVFVPVIVGQGMRFKLFAKVEDDIAPARRAMEQYEKSICDREFFKETRTLGCFNYFIQSFRDSIALVNKRTFSAEMRHTRTDLLLRSITLLGYMGILAMLASDLLSGQITPGAFAAVFAAVSMMFSFAESVFGTFMGRITRYAATIQNYQAFIDLPEKAGDPGDFNAQKGLSVYDVHFKYPDAKEEALCGVTLNIRQGETIAVVGENGAGKSTLVKLLLGLYRPTSGRVLVAGLDTSQVQVDSIYRGLSAVFQRYQRYRTTVQENVSISDGCITGDQIAEKVKLACEMADLHTTADFFPEGQQTMLSREFDGVDLSGGQWQRIAIARGLYRAHEIIALDEPTAAIDPIDESFIYNKFIELSRGKTALIVTHRLGSARIADRIVVMKRGLIDDVGTHEELIKRNDLYATLYQSQAKLYESNENAEEENGSIAQ